MADIKQVIEIYGIDCNKPKIMPSNDVRTSYLLNGQYVLELSNTEFLTDNKVVLINKLVDRYRSYGLLAPKYIKNEEGNYVYQDDNNYYAVYEYINEKRLKDSTDVKYLNINKELFKYIGEYSQMYKNDNIMPFRTTHSIIDLSPVDSEIDEKQSNLNMLCDALGKAGFIDLKNKLIKYNNKLREELKTIFKKLPRCNYQGNLTSSSVIIKDGHFAGLTDFSLCGSEVIVNYFSCEARADITEEDFINLSAPEIKNKIINDHKKNLSLILDHYVISDEEKKALDIYNRLLFISGFSYYSVYKNILRTKDRNRVVTVLNILIL